MTCLEKWRMEYANGATDSSSSACPHDFGYLEQPDDCKNGFGYKCSECWDREIPEEPLPEGYRLEHDVVRDADGNLHLKPTEETRRILDSGSKTEFTTGAVRDSREGKGRCDLLPLDVVAECMNNAVLGYIANFQQNGCVDELCEALYAFSDHWDDGKTKASSKEIVTQRQCTMLLETSKQYAEGAERYGENNWKNGMPVKIYIDSAVRHYLKFLRGDEDEPHDRAVCWNLMCAIWTCKHKPELNDYASKETSDTP